MPSAFWHERSVWVSGATGAWGQEIVKQLLSLPVRRVLAFCRGEHRAADLHEYSQDDRLRIRLGDIRDRDRVSHALAGADIVIHTAALKRVDTITYNAIEIARTNVDGTASVVEACAAARPEKALFISSDKAVKPLNLYGATKMVAEHLWLAGNSYAPPPRPCRFSVLRSGNALGSTGSVLHIWKSQKKRNLPLTITDPSMTRFHITLGDAVRFLLANIETMEGGEVFIPPMRAYSIEELAAAFVGPGSGYPITIIGSRGMGEKVAEQLTPDGPTSSEVPRIPVPELWRILGEEGWA
jgi:UDP-N-acetylglucosamine 4,6-dehydratase